MNLEDLGDDERTESEDNRHRAFTRDIPLSQPSAARPDISPDPAATRGIISDDSVLKSFVSSNNPFRTNAASAAFDGKQAILPSTNAAATVGVTPTIAAPRQVPQPLQNPREPGYDADDDVDADADGDGDADAVVSSDTASSAPVKRSSDGALQQATPNTEVASLEFWQTKRLACEFDVEPSSKWWMASRGVPPSLALRSDVLYEIEESERWKRGNLKFTTRDIYVLFRDYSQTVITVEFSKQPDNGHVAFQQRLVDAPGKLRKDQLEHAYMRFGKGIAKDLREYVGRRYRPGGAAAAGSFISTVLQDTPESLPGIGGRTYGALIYCEVARDASGGAPRSDCRIVQFDELRAGDIAVMAGRPAAEGEDEAAAGVVYEWDVSQGQLHVYEQSAGEGVVQAKSYSLGQLECGEMRVFRVVGRDYVGW